MSVRTRDYITAARIQGISTAKILFKHIFPNVFTPIFITATLGIAGAILTESALSFLGLGVQPPVPSWGNILTAGKDNILFAWWLSFFPGIAIFITVLGYNLLGEGLRDVLDPKE
jgi:peptide/nickel transport system permease protein